MPKPFSRRQFIAATATTLAAAQFPVRSEDAKPTEFQLACMTLPYSQFPLARAYAKLETAQLMVQKGAWKFDHDQPCGEEANIAKHEAAEAGCEACDASIQTHGGMGYAREFHVERLWREVRLYKLAPVSQEMALNFIGEHVLKLPKSY